MNERPTDQEIMDARELLERAGMLVIDDREINNWRAKTRRRFTRLVFAADDGDIDAIRELLRYLNPDRPYQTHPIVQRWVADRLRWFFADADNAVSLDVAFGLKSAKGGRPKKSTRASKARHVRVMVDIIREQVEQNEGRRLTDEEIFDHLRSRDPQFSKTDSREFYRLMEEAEKSEQQVIDALNVKADINPL